MFYKRTQFMISVFLKLKTQKSTLKNDKIVVKSGRVLIWRKNTLQSILKNH